MEDKVEIIQGYVITFTSSVFDKNIATFEKNGYYYRQSYVQGTFSTSKKGAWKLLTKSDDPLTIQKYHDKGYRLKKANLEIFLIEKEG